MAAATNFALKKKRRTRCLRVYPLYKQATVLSPAAAKPLVHFLLFGNFRGRLQLRQPTVPCFSWPVMCGSYCWHGYGTHAYHERGKRPAVKIVRSRRPPQV